MPEQWALVALTAVLVVVTGYYAWQNHQIVLEMRAARGAVVMPNLMPSMTYLAPEILLPTVTNVGLGPALNVNMMLTFEPGAGYERRWQQSVMTPGEQHEFLLRGGASGFASMQELGANYSELRIVGTCRDSLGASHSFDERIEIKESWELAKASGERLRDNYAKQSADSLKKIAAEVSRIALK